MNLNETLHQPTINDSLFRATRQVDHSRNYRPENPTKSWQVFTSVNQWVIDTFGSETVVFDEHMALLFDEFSRVGQDFLIGLHKTLHYELLNYRHRLGEVDDPKMEFCRMTYFAHAVDAWLVYRGIVTTEW